MKNNYHGFEISYNNPQKCWFLLFEETKPMWISIYFKIGVAHFMASLYSPATDGLRAFYLLDITTVSLIPGANFY
jgi:hypothetical protein